MASSPSARFSVVVGAAEEELIIATMLPEEEDMGTLFSSSNGEVMEKMLEKPGFGSESCFERGGLGSLLKSARGRQPHGSRNNFMTRGIP